MRILLFLCSFVFISMATNRRESVTRTIRIEKENDLVLVQEADRTGYSVNSLLGQIIRRYTQFERFVLTRDNISIGREIFIDILSNLSDDVVINVAENYGAERINQSLLQRGMPLTLVNVLWFVNQILGEHQAWFRCDQNLENGVYSLHCSHNNGRKWSVFIRHYLSSFFQDVLNKKVDTVILPNAVHFNIRK